MTNLTFGFPYAIVGTTAKVRYYGYSISHATETYARQYVTASTIKKLRVYVFSNTLDDECVYTLRKNGAPTASHIHVPAGATGVFSFVGDVAFAEDDYFTIEHDASFITAGALVGNISVDFLLA